MSDYKPHVVIDEQKNIILPEELKNHMVQYDHNVKTITFDCPRYSDGRDLSTMRIYVNYFRKSGEKDADRCENITVDSKDNNLIHFEWVPKRSATLEQGILAFLICAEKEDAGGNQENAWHTKLCKDLKIAEGIDCLNAVIEKYPTIITYLLTRMEDVESIATPEAMQTYVNQYLLDYPPSGMTEEERALLEENFALTKQIQEDLASTTQSKADAIICEAEGTTIVATDSSDAGFEGLSLYGKSKQGSTTGKNLLKNTATSKTVNGVTFTVNDDGSITANGTATAQVGYYVGTFSAKANENYLINGMPNNSDGGNYFYYLSGTKYAYSGDTLLTESNDKDLAVQIIIPSGVTVNNINFYPMIRLASIEDDTYELYTGNKPSPNPEYPQEVVGAGNSGSIEGKVCGKNLLKYPYSNTTKTVNGITFTDNGDGSVTVNGTATADTKFTCVANFQFKKGETYITTGCPEGGGGSKYYLSSLGTDYGSGVVYTANADAKIWIQIGIKSGATCNNLVFKPMIRLASIEDDAYETYSEQTITLQTPNGLPGIKVSDASLATYTDENGQMWCADEIDVERGVYVKRVAGRVINFTNVNAISSTSDGLKWSYGAYAIDSSLQYKMNGAHTSIMCDKFTLVAQQYEGDESTGTCASAYGHANNLEFRFRLLQSEYPTKEDAMNAINGTTVYYPLATPIETPLSDEEILAYKALHTNKPTTIIMNSENVYMKAKYVADTKKYIQDMKAKHDADIEELKTAIIALGGTV